MKYTKENLVDVLANGLSGQIAFNTIDYDKAEYNEAKAQLNDDNYCWEDVLVQMLVSGKVLKLLDDEDKWHDLTLDNLENGCDLYFKKGYASRCKNFDKLADNGDLYDYEAILQFAIYGEVIYG